LILVSLPARADSLRISCGPQGELRSFTPPGSVVVNPQHVPLSIPEAGACGETKHCLEESLALPKGFLSKNGNVIEALQAVSSYSVAKQLATAADDCGDAAEKESRPHLPRTVTLRYDHAGPNRNKAGIAMPTDVFETIAKASLAQGLDPYLAMAVVLMENDPSEELYHNYASNYGVIPVDGYPAYSELGCLADRSSKEGKIVSDEDRATYANARLALIKGGRNESIADDLLNDILNRYPAEQRPFAKSDIKCDSSCPGRFVKQKKVPEFDLSGGEESVSRIFCSPKGGELVHGAPAELTPEKSIDPGRCCLTMKVPKAKPFYVADAYSYLGAMEILQKVTRNLKPGGDSLSFAIQRYNGLGVFGATEKMKSDCLSGIDMRMTPVYGARTADLMVSSLMANKTLQQVVSQALADKPLPSVLCRSKGPGDHTIDTDEFFHEQKAYLSGRPGCEKLFR
ncbi:MAG: hypothetical protein ACXVB9_20080, partial [Bdellovibrionota bacterium]